MKREPLGLYLLRFFLSLGLFAFMAMLYWSSLLVEEDLKAVQSGLQDVAEGLKELKDSLSVISSEVRHKELKIHSQEKQSKEASDLASIYPFMDPRLPNLLSEDVFYAKTLPKLLPKGFAPKGSRKTATIGNPPNLKPFTNWSEASGWISQCSVQLARLKFGRYETFAPDMALKIEERIRKDLNVPEYWVFLRNDVFWQPLSEMLFDGKVKLAPQFLEKHQVTAADYKFWFDAMMNPSVQEPAAVSLRNYLGDIEEIEILDPLTFVVRWRPKKVVNDEGKPVLRVKYVTKQLTGSLRPLASHIYQYFPDGSKIIQDDSDPDTYRKNSVWAQNFAQHWANTIIPSCGAWIFEGKTDRQISFRRNPNHYFPLDVLVQKSEVAFKNSTDSIWQGFKAGNIDSYTLQPDQLIELNSFLNSSLYEKQKKQGMGISRLEYPGRSYMYIGWNEKRPWFKSRKIRQAMTFAIDRERIIEQYLNGMGIEITGPFAHDSPAYDKSIKPWPFDLQSSRDILDEEGWYDSDGDGIIDKMIDGKRVPFEFTLTYFVKNPTTKSIVEYVASALKELGIRVHLNGVDLADLSAVFDDKNFDALCLGWALGTPPEDPRQLWYSAGADEPGSSNMIGFVNQEADSIINALDFENNPEKRIALYHRFHAIIHEEQPYTFLYAPTNLFLYRDYLQNVWIPAKRQDLVPGADITEPNGSIIWIKKK